MTEFEYITTDATVDIYEASNGVFTALLAEVKELSKKKPDATLSASKVKIINTVLIDLLTILKSEPEGKYLQTLESDDLPQVSDALMMMAQFNAALTSFRKRYYQYIGGSLFWITEELLEAWNAEEGEN